MLYFIARAPYDGDGGGGGRVARVYWKTGFEKHIAHKIEQDLSRHTKQQQQAETRDSLRGFLREVHARRYKRNITATFRRFEESRPSLVDTDNRLDWKNARFNYTNTQNSHKPDECARVLDKSCAAFVLSCANCLQTSYVYSYTHTQTHTMWELI